MTAMKIITPPALHKGDTIGIIAPASPPSSIEKITKGAEYFERLGYRIRMGKNVEKIYGYLAGTDAERADDINDMFADNAIKAIVAVRGGYGTPRILPQIDYGLIKRNPKILVGYSDLTGLQLAIFKKTGLVTFSGPMSGVEMFKGIDPFTEEHFWQMITSTKAHGALRNPDDRSFRTICKGKATGRLLGGNLSLITSVLGTEYSPSYENSILFIEEIDEETYRFDRMMNHLRLAGVFSEAHGIVVGELTDVKASDTTKPTLTVDHLLHHYLGSLSKPVLEGMVYGHIPRKLTIPIGIRASVDANERHVSFLEPAVS